MAIIIKKARHFYTRIPIFFLLTGLLAMSPILISMAGAWVTEYFTGQPCHEGNCIWGAFGWFFMITFPAAAVILLIGILLIIIDTVNFFKK